MNSKERVLAAIGHKGADRIPRGEIVVDDSVVRSFLGCEEVGFDEQLRFVSTLGLDLVCLTPSPARPSPDGVPPGPEGAKWRHIEQWASRADRFIFILLDGAFDWGMKLLGFRKFLISLMREGSDLTDIIKDVEALNTKLARRALDLGAMGILLADDIAYHKGLLANPRVLRRSILPSLARQTEAFSKMGLPVFFHSDGNINEILPDLTGIGLAGLQCLEFAAGMDLPSVSRQYGRDLCLWGNLDPRHLTDPHTPEEIAEAVNAILAVAGTQGGFIFGTSSGLFKGMRPENLAAVYTALDAVAQTGTF
jgi:uroporphyrinogen decarboxylase